jgi:hypothetical protein
MRQRQDKQYRQKGSLGLRALITLAVLGVFIVGGLLAFSSAMGIRGQGIRQETGLNAQHLENQNELSSYVSGFYEQTGLGQYKSDKLNQILTDYAKGRNFAKEGQSEQAAFINAVVEAVPDLSGLNIFDKIVDYVQAGRERYRAKQEKLLDMLRFYDNWVSGEESAWRWLVVNYSPWKFPSDRLEARVGTEKWTGAKAREQMYLIVTTSSTKDAYKSGTMEPLVVPPGKK